MLAKQYCGTVSRVQPSSVPDHPLKDGKLVAHRKPGGATKLTPGISRAI